MSPDPRERDLVKCEDMRLYAERAVQYLGALSLEEFLADDMVQSAVIRCVEVIGEAARLGRRQHSSAFARNPLAAHCRHAPLPRA
jgi:uncharacterized protein with HEPN domain